MIPDSDTVFISRQPGVSYDSTLRESAPELPSGEATGAAAVLLRRLLTSAGLDGACHGTAGWNPLSEVVRPGDRVVVKPNWVFHVNESGNGLDCLVTHTAVLKAVLEYAVKCRPGEIVVGDAPLQGCRLPELWEATGVETMVRRFAGSGVRIELRDFRTTRRSTSRIAEEPISTGRSRENYVEFDLGRSSWLEAVTGGGGKFRVSMYDPRELERTHAPGTHRYLVAREIVDADVVIGLPKLKTHKRAGLTGALKNFVGINGRKDYLPHHRAGGSAQGGDNYQGRDAVRGLAENCADCANKSSASWIRLVLQTASEGLLRFNSMRGACADVGGSWYGNDTIWRTVLDLNRIVEFGRADGSIGTAPQRRVLHITDAIVAGEGNGPMRPSPVPLGAMTLAVSAAAADWVHALVIGFDPAKIPLLRNAILEGASQYRPIRAVLDGKPLDRAEVAQDWPRFEPPSGWKGHCEKEEVNAC